MLGSYNIKPRQVRALIILLILLPLFPTAVIIRFFIDSARYEIETVELSQDALYSSYARVFTSYLNNQLEREFADAVAEGGDVVRIAQTISAERHVASVSAPARQMSWQDGRQVESVAGRYPPAADSGALWNADNDTGSYFRVLAVNGEQLVIRRSTSDLEQVTASMAQQSSGPDIQLDIVAATTTGSEVAESPDEIAFDQPLEWLASGWKLRLTPVSTALPEASINEQLQLYRQITIIILAAVLSLGLMAGFGISQQLKIHDLRNTALASVAHELKTPIASSKVLLETLQNRDAELDGQTREYLTLLARDNQRLAVIVADFLLLARLEQRSYNPKRQLIELDALITDALDSMAAQLAEAGIEVDTDLAAEIYISGDYDAILRVVLNLLQNVVRHAADGKWLGVKLQAANSHAEITISDRGPGIARSELRRIFRPFYQIDTTLARNRDGVGLGLSIVRELVRLHDGKIQVNSSDKSGTNFCLQLPRVSLEN